MKVALLANLKQNAPTWPGIAPDQWHNLDTWETIQSITIALEKGGHRVIFLEGDRSLYNNLDAVKPDVCFNLCRGHFSDSREAQIPAILELLRIPYTGSSVLTLALAMDKPMTKRMLIHYGLPTPAFQVLEREDESLDAGLHFPLRVKLSQAETELHINGLSIVHDQTQLRTQLRRVIDQHHQPALVEQFIEGRQITVGIVGNPTAPIARYVSNNSADDRIFQGLHIFPPLEANMVADLTLDSPGGVALVSDVPDHYPARLPRIEDLKRLAAITFRVMGCRDVACIDFQLDANDNDKPYILNVNPLPSLSSGYSDLCLAANADGWDYEELINRILDEAFKRHQLDLAETGLQHNLTLEKLPLVA